MTTLVKAINRLEQLFVKVGADQKEAEEALEVFSEVYEERLATKEYVKSQVDLLTQKLESLTKTVWWFGTLIVGGILLQIIVSISPLLQ